MKSYNDTSMALATDLYQITMAYAYWKAGRHEEEAVFNLFFRSLPFDGANAVAAGLDTAIDFIESFCLSEEDLGYLAGLEGKDGHPLFEQAFLNYLTELRFEGEIYAIPEGTRVFPHEPLVRFKGPVLLGQWLETPLLNIINFQTLIATKAARICAAAEGDEVLEFGLRRAQGMDGGLSASRAAYIGGCNATSNVLAGRRYGIPVRGTHAHSWVMSYEDELESFQSYAAALPGNCVFLVDTYDTLEGVRRAIQVGRELWDKGHDLIGIRLDSGDLAALSIAARHLLDEAGLTEAVIVASNDLDEYEIAQLKARGARINVWGVGTRLVTARDQPALGGVYKLAATRKNAGTPWRPCMKRSEDAIKASNPGIQNVRRWHTAEGALDRDVIYEEGLGCSNPGGTDLLQPIFVEGKCVYTRPAMGMIREHALAQQRTMPEQGGVSVELDPALQQLKNELAKL